MTKQDKPYQERIKQDSSRNDQIKYVLINVR